MPADSVLQPPIPTRFRVPTLVQPQWALRDLAVAFNAHAIHELADEIRRQYGVKHCLLLDRARTGLYLLVRGMRLSGEWLTTSFMHRPTAALLHNIASGLALAEIREDFTMDPRFAEDLIGSSTEALLVTHIYGKSAAIRRFRELADRRKLFLVENAVHMCGGVEVEGRRLGAWGDAAILSFNVDKPLGGILGGALLTNRDDVWRAVTSYDLSRPATWEIWDRIFKTYIAYRFKPRIMQLPFMHRLGGAKDGAAEVESFAMISYRTYAPRAIHPLQAAVALAAMHRSSGLLQARLENAKLLRDQLRDVEGIKLPSSCLEQPHTYLYFPVIFTRVDRYEAGRRYAQFGIETKWRYYPLHMQRDFSDCRQSSLETTEYCWRNHLLLPVGPSLTSNDIAYIARCTETIATSRR